MSQKPAFTSVVAENYEKYFSPMFFAIPAKDLAGRMPDNIKLVLELACGTGQVTRILEERFPNAEIIGTDLFPGMIEIARSVSGKDSGIEWKTMDATDISFDDNLFDAVVCQFGVMFFPDKQKAFNEAYRALKPGGTFIFSTWDSIEKQHIAEVNVEVVNSFFPNDPVTFFDIPFSMSDPAEMEELMKNSGFKNVLIEYVELEGSTASAKDAAKGFILGNPIYNYICERDEKLLPEILNAVRERFSEEFGAGAFNISLSVIITSGIK